MVAIIQQGIFIRTDINNASGIAQRKCRITAPVVTSVRLSPAAGLAPVSVTNILKSPVALTSSSPPFSITAKTAIPSFSTIKRPPLIVDQSPRHKPVALHY